MAASTVPFEIPGCRLDAVQQFEAGLLILAHSTARTAACPACDRRSRRVHSYYIRAPTDLPVSDRTVHLRLRLRRFRCMHVKRPRRTFAEPLPRLLVRYARRTMRLSSAQMRVGFATGAQPGARLLAALRMPTSPDTLLRLMHRLPPPEADTPRVLGVDDWAWCRGRAWGTILVDLEKRRPVDLLPDRAADSVSAWLREHPGVEIVARDRSTEYARGITEGAPDARQVADRWHLLHNLRQTLIRYLTTSRSRLATLPAAAAPPGGSDEAQRQQPQRRSLAEQAASEAARQRRYARFIEVRRLHTEAKLNIRQITHALGISRATVRKYIAAGTFPEWGRHPSPARALAAYEDHLTNRWTQGCRVALVLWREIRDLGYVGSSRQVSRWMQQRRTSPHSCTPKGHRATCLEPPESVKRGDALPSTRRMAWLLVRDPEALSAAEAAALSHIRQDSEVAALHELSRSYTRMIREHLPDSLDGWLTSCAESGIDALKSFGNGLRQDYGAVRAALEEPWSSGQAEGQINRLKMLKRKMYGRAGFDLLRRRVLYPA